MNSIQQSQENSQAPLCGCGCGLPTNKSRDDRPDQGYVKGQYARFRRGHAARAARNGRFWNRIRISTDEDGCWVWTGQTNKAGYGRVHRQPGFVYAHRLSYELMYGPIPPGVLVCHKCDNPPCVRPDHLFLGTHTDNARDKIEKGRAGRGAAKLSDEQVRAIRAADLSKHGAQKALARGYGVDPATIRAIRSGKSYAHVRS